MIASTSSCDLSVIVHYLDVLCFCWFLTLLHVVVKDAPILWGNSGPVSVI